MIITTQIGRDDKGRLTAERSKYRPKKNVKDVTKLVMEDFQIAHTTKTKPYREFNGLSLMSRQSIDQRRFNSVQDDQATSPDDEWKSNAVRPITRNRAISIAAHVTGSIMYPNVYAQNENDEEDRDSAMVMRDLMEWASDRSDYDRTFVYAAIAMLVNPAVIIHTEYAEVYRTIRVENDMGLYEDKEILDELYSGFQDTICPLDEIWIPDFYEHNIQKQQFLIRRRALTYEAAEAKHGQKDNFKKYVQPGVQVMFVKEENAYYDQIDENLQGRFVEEIIYWNRSKDLMVVFCNGVIMTDYNQPNPRQDKNYPFVKSGYELIDEGKFFFFKSLVNKMGPDEEVIQTLWRMIIDGTYLQLMPPIVSFGSETITSQIIAPGNVVTLKEGSKLEALQVGSNLNAGMSMLQKVEQSMSESSIDVQQSGVQSEGPPKTAFEVSRLEQNAKVMLGLFGKMIGFLVKDIGALRISDILQYLTLGDVMETTDTQGAVKFRNFLLPEKTIDGKQKSRKIVFDPDMPSEHLTEDQLLKHQFDLMEKEGGMDNKTQIVRVNPDLFGKMKFMTKVTADIVTPPSDNVRKTLNLELYDRAIANPLANQESVTRDLLFGSYETTKRDPDKYMKTEQPGLASLVGADQGGQVGNQPGTIEGDKAQNINQAKMATKSAVIKQGV